MSIRSRLGELIKNRRRNRGNVRPRVFRLAPQVELLESRRVLATVTLNTDMGLAGELRTEIANAAPGETIDFNLSAGNETIVLNGAMGSLLVDKELTIDGDNGAGSGVDVTISGGDAVRVLTVDDLDAYTAVPVTLNNITITGGQSSEGAGILNAEDLTLSNATVTGNTATSGAGGGIYSRGYGSALTLSYSAVDGNYATSYGPLAGGGIATAVGALTIEDSTVSNNTATGTPGTFFAGGGIATTSNGAYYTYGALDVTISRSVISGNAVVGVEDAYQNGVNPYGGGFSGYGYGQVTIDDTTLSGNTAAGDVNGYQQAIGGGVSLWNNYATMYASITNSTVTGNMSTNRAGGIGVYTSFYYDYGSYSSISNGYIELSIAGTTISDNTTNYYGGGMWVSSGDAHATVQITESTISGNTANSSGGLTNWNSYVTIDSSEISNNAAISDAGFQYGGGVTNYGLFLDYAGYATPTMIISNSTISGNSTTGAGGGVYNFGGDLQVIQSTISGNMAAASGGGIAMVTYVGTTNGPKTGSTSIDRSTITLNTADGGYGGGGLYADYYQDSFAMGNTILSGNTTYTGYAADAYDYSTAAVIANSTTNSLVGDNDGTALAEANPGPDAAGNILGGSVSGVVDALLGALASNGGATLTHLPADNSPAVDAADASVMPGADTDQRGFERVVDGDMAGGARMDMGSVEVGAESPVVDGDFNDDGFWDCDDINALSTEAAAGTDNPAFDLTGDGLVNLDDISAWLVEGGAMNPGATGGNPFLPGDANLDGNVDGQDFIAWNVNKFSSNSNWCDGNFNGDSVVDGQDFVTWNQFKFMSSSVTAPFVPVETEIPLMQAPLRVVAQSARVPAAAFPILRQAQHDDLSRESAKQDAETDRAVTDRIFSTW